ncbi:MAG: metal ABC transporter substrate-binding protein, partial [Thermodesulfobacteriota bacterium]
LGKGYQNPHFVDPKPTFIITLNKADLLLHTGLEQEIGWLPLLITASRNSKISTEGASGNIDCSKFIKNILEIPSGQVDRSLGDIHPGGNPHYMLNPRNGLQVAEGLYQKLSEIDPINRSFYEINYLNFSKKLSLKIIEWEKKLKPYNGSNFITYHKLWPYFFDWANFNLVDTMEPIPGVPPSPSHISKLVEKAQNTKVDLVISSNYFPEKTPKIIADKIGADFLSLPVMVGGNDKVKDYIGFFDFLIDQITSKLNS